jgi:O-antigen/teichoic acid export membrane protein
MRTLTRRRYKLKSAKPKSIKKPKIKNYIIIALMVFCFILAIPFLLLALFPLLVCFILWAIAIVLGVILRGTYV